MNEHLPLTNGIDNKGFSDLQNSPPKSISVNLDRLTSPLFLTGHIINRWRYCKKTTVQLFEHL